MLVKADFNTHMYPELIAAIDRNDDDILEEAIAAAEAEAKGYLSYYDLDQLFPATADLADPALVLRIKDITIWHFIVLANPNTDMELRKTRYEEAISWLKDIQSGKVYYENWPLPPVPPGEDPDPGSFIVNSQPKRETRF